MLDLPPRLRALLERDPVRAAAVHATAADFLPWVAGSATPLFPEYTDHGPDHLRDVLRTAEGLIADRAWDVLTPADAAVLVVAVLLHDCAMHLSEDGLLALVASDAPSPVDGFGDRPWAALWAEFLGEARRFDARQLTTLFGDPTPARVPPPSPADWTRRDRQLAGEFVRRHHHRLAHEIAHVGVPGPVGPVGQRLRLAFREPDLADLAGLVARSHGMPLRACLDYLRAHYDVREYRGVHAVFLMAALRVADYLQIEAPRAPDQQLRVRALRSPVSRREWRTHHAVRDVRHTHDDPEAVFVDARPADVEAYLRLSEWLAGIQGELDASWAVLGEVYGRVEALAGLGLLLRRVRSNLDDAAAFARTVDYVPRRAAFTAAGAELLKLLVEPLYGDRPEVGVRELVQNAVDAVREWAALTPDAGRDLAVDVSVEEDTDGVWWLTVRDDGVGMTEDVLVDYFLRAGASFRRSDAWRRRFEGANGHATVLRTGRFGVGAVAAFLLGPELEVSTRHATAPEAAGVAFRATLEADAVELRRVARPVGTTIRVRLTKPLEAPTVQLNVLAPDGRTEVLEIENNILDLRLDGPLATPRPPGPLRVAWDWYGLAAPPVRLAYAGRPVAPRYRLPAAHAPHAALGAAWGRCAADGFDDVQWTYGDAPWLAVNGFLVEERAPDADARYVEGPVVAPTVSLDGTVHRSGGWPHTRQRPRALALAPEHHYLMTAPKLSVFDADGRFPLTLQRDRMAGGALPFADALLDAVLDDLLAFCVARLPEAPLPGPGLLDAYAAIRYPGFYMTGDWGPWFATGAGVGLLDAWPLEAADLHAVLVLPDATGVTPLPLPALPLGPREAAVTLGLRAGTRNAQRWLKVALGAHPDAGARQQRTPLERRVARGRRVLLPRYVADDASGLRMPERVRAHVEVEAEGRDWLLWRVGRCPPTRRLTPAFANALFADPAFARGAARATAAAPLLAEWYIEPRPRRYVMTSLLGHRWRERFRRAVLPFAPAERHALIAPAPAAFRDRVAAHRAAPVPAARGRHGARARVAETPSGPFFYRVTGEDDADGTMRAAREA